MSNKDEYQPFRSPRATAASFWDALTPVERTDFASSAAERTFAGGATLMEEGETADHVIVILSGRTKICVEKDGMERIIAYRGPGQLIGERAALRVSVRSATVVALETVHALAMKTEDFASFVSNHQGVLGIVEGQVYQRLREDPGYRECDGHHVTEARRRRRCIRRRMPIGRWAWTASIASSFTPMWLSSVHWPATTTIAASSHGKCGR